MGHPANPSPIEQEFIDALKFKQKKDELRADYIKRLVADTNEKLPEKKYDKLSDKAKAWYAAAVEAVDKGQPIQEFPDADKAQVERRFGNPVAEDRKLAKRAGKSNSDKGGSGEAAAEDGTDPAPEAGTAAKRRAKAEAQDRTKRIEKIAPSVQKAVAAKLPKATGVRRAKDSTGGAKPGAGRKPGVPQAERTPKSDGVAAQVAQVLTRRPKATFGDVMTALEKKRGGPPNKSHVQSAYHFARTTLYYAQKNGWTGPSGK